MTETPLEKREESPNETKVTMVHTAIVFLVVALLTLLSLRDFMSLMAVMITLSFVETKALYLFLLTRSALFGICARGVWKRHRPVGFLLTNGLLIASFLFNYYLAKIDPVEKSRATDAMLAALVGVILLHFLDYFPKNQAPTKASSESLEKEEAEVAPDTEDKKNLPPSQN
jgi:multisubunit Na+/H+ antiporter MnhB subunit